MIFQKYMMDIIFNEIETQNMEICWKAFCNCVDIKQINGSCM